MTPWAALAIFGAGLAAGTINTIVGSGSLITFPTLLALGYPPVLANVSNNVGLVPGSTSGVWPTGASSPASGPAAHPRARRRCPAGSPGAVLLLALPSSVFKAAVPALVLLAAVLMAVQPRISAVAGGPGRRQVHGGPLLLVGVFLTGVYGGYFGAAQGVILISLLAIFIDDRLQRLNGTKNVLAMVVNAVAAVVFVVFTHVSWSVAGLIALGSTIGGQLGGHSAAGSRPPSCAVCIVGVGVGVSIVLFVEWH